MISVIFDSNSPYYEMRAKNDHDYNLFFLKARKKELIIKEQHQGYLFLNEALDALGLKRRKDGYKLGWAKLAKENLNLYNSIFGIMIDPDDTSKIVIKFLGVRDITKEFEEACDD